MTPVDDMQARIQELEEALARVTAERDALLSGRHAVRPASVAQALRAVVDERHGGNVAAAARALGYRSTGAFRNVLAQGDALSGTVALKCQQRLDAMHGQE